MKLILLFIAGFRAQKCEPIEGFDCNSDLTVSVKSKFEFLNPLSIFSGQIFVTIFSVNKSCIEERGLTGYYVLLNGRKCESCQNDDFVFDLDDTSHANFSYSEKVEISTEISLRKGSHGILLGGLDLGKLTCVYKKTVSVSVDYSSKLTNEANSPLVINQNSVPEAQSETKVLVKYERISETFDSPSETVTERTRIKPDGSLLTKVKQTSGTLLNSLSTLLLILLIH